MVEVSLKENIVKKSQNSVSNFLFIYVAVLMFVLVVPSYHQSPIRLDGAFTKDLEVVENWVHSGGKSGINSRYIFIYLPENAFTRTTISESFDKYQQDFCDPYILAISIYSDKTMLAKKIRFEKNPIGIEFNNDIAGRKAANDYYRMVLPAPNGYFRAEYQRYGDYENFAFSVAKEDFVLTRVILRDPRKESTSPMPKLTRCKSPTS